MKGCLCILTAFLLGTIPAVLALDDAAGKEAGGKNGVAQGRFSREAGRRPPLFNGEKGGQARRKFLSKGRGEEIILIMGKLRKEKPEEFKRLDNLRKTAPEQFLVEVRPYFQKTPNTMAALLQSEFECRRLAGKIRKTEDAGEKARLKEELTAKLSENFDKLLKDMEERVTRLKEQLDSLQTNKEGILEERLEHFLNAPIPPEGGWLPPEAGGRAPDRQRPEGNGEEPPPPPPPGEENPRANGELPPPPPPEE